MADSMERVGIVLARAIEHHMQDPDWDGGVRFRPDEVDLRVGSIILPA